MRTWILAFVALALAAPDVLASSDELRKRISAVDEHFDQLRGGSKELRKHAATGPRDFRGRRKADDVEQWVFTPEFEKRVEGLLREARARDETAANAALDEATKLVDGALARAQEVARYWDTQTVFRWNELWKSFANSNGIPVEPNGQTTLDAEKVVLGFLESGDFVNAAITGAMIEAKLLRWMREASEKMVQTRNPDNLTFIPRSTPCPSAGPPSPKARISRFADPQDFYPRKSEQNHEQGDIVIRARVPASGCATHFAIFVASGYPDLDRAAIKLAETCEFSAATENAQPIDSQMNFKVSFRLKK